MLRTKNFPLDLVTGFLLEEAVSMNHGRKKSNFERLRKRKEVMRINSCRNLVLKEKKEENSWKKISAQEILFYFTDNYKETIERER